MKWKKELFPKEKFNRQNENILMKTIYLQNNDIHPTDELPTANYNLTSRSDKKFKEIKQNAVSLPEIPSSTKKPKQILSSDNKRNMAITMDDDLDYEEDVNDYKKRIFHNKIIKMKYNKKIGYLPPVEHSNYFVNSNK